MSRADKAPGTSGEMKLRPMPQSAGEARRFVADALAGGPASHVTDTVVLLTSEVVTNAIVHAGTQVKLKVAVTDRVVRVEVSDKSRQQPKRRHSPPSVVGGHGLELVEALARDWGVTKLLSGKRVWFEVDLHDE